MTNGSNLYGVSFNTISFFDSLIARHKNVAEAQRHDDILWSVERFKGRPIEAICIDEYACGLGKVLEVLTDYKDTNLIWIGGVWNSYTMDAKEYCVENEIGLFNTGEMTGALFMDQFWKYHKKDEEGNPLYG